MKVSSKPLYERYLLGIQAEYKAETGAKQMDPPRSELFRYSIHVKPGIAAIMGSHRVGGLSLEYENMIQETRGGHSNSDDQVNQNVFVMRGGLGNHYTAVIGGLQSLGSFIYDANKVGAGLQYGWQQQALRFSQKGDTASAWKRR